MYLSR